ncbi:MAG: acyltransferase [Rhodothermales bacterium]|nr:acyltransferase [Rhodothermales bacterium]
MKVSVVQYTPEYLKVDANLDRLDGLCAATDADLIVLPELAASGYFFKSVADLVDVSEQIPDGRVCRRLQKIAQRRECTIVCGVAEKNGPYFFNSAVVVGAEGVAAAYRKVHLFYKEKELFRAGKEPYEVIDLYDRNGTKYRLGVMICFDWYFPEAARSLALKGADLIAHPSNLVRKDCPRAMPIRALENRVFTATANRTGSESHGDETLTFIGQSLICSPDGQAIGSLSATEEAVLTAEIDISEARNKRITPLNDLFLDRRPGRYYY